MFGLAVGLLVVGGTLAFVSIGRSLHLMIGNSEGRIAIEVLRDRLGLLYVGIFVGIVLFALGIPILAEAIRPLILPC